MDSRAVGLLVAVAGVGVVVVGLLIAMGMFGWFGRLPGDIRFGNENVSVYLPIASMILVSIVLTVLVNLLRRLF